MSAIEWVKPFIDKNIIWFTNKSKTISFQIWIVKVDENGVKSTVDMRHESTKQTFVALFDDKDTDFEIVYRNHSCNRMCFGITYGKNYGFIIKKGVLSSLKAFESNGHHLRFLSPNLPTGQSVVDMIANKDPDSRRNAEIMCSRMKIALWLDRNPLYGSTIVPNLLSEMTAESDGSDPQIVVFINALNETPLQIKIDRLMTVDDLKHLIHKRTGHPFDHQILICDGIELENRKTIGEYDIKCNSTIYLARLNAKNPVLTAKQWREGMSVYKDNVDKVVPKLKPSVECMGEAINVFVRTLELKTITTRIGRLNKLYDLKVLIQEKADINMRLNEMRLIFGGKELDNDKTIDENHITNDSTLHLTSRLRGGLKGDLKRNWLSEKPDQINDILLRIPDVDKYVGKRGVIGFGDKTNQKFSPKVTDFVADRHYCLEPFFIEFRLKSN